MSTTRTPKVSERVAPKAADADTRKKRGDHDDDGPDFRTLLNAWLEAIAPAWPTACAAWASSRSAASSPAWSWPSR